MKRVTRKTGAEEAAFSRGCIVLAKGRVVKYSQIFPLKNHSWKKESPLHIPGNSWDVMMKQSHSLTTWVRTFPPLPISPIFNPARLKTQVWHAGGGWSHKEGKEDCILVSTREGETFKLESSLKFYFLSGLDTYS